MDRGAWQVTVHRVTRVGHDLATKPPPPPKPAQLAPIWGNAFPSTLLFFSSIPVSWITPFYQGKFSCCLEFLSFYHISVPIFWVLSPLPTKPLSLALAMASLSPWDFPQPSPSSRPIVTQPSHPAPDFGFLGLHWTTFGPPPPSQATSLQLHLPTPHLPTALNGSSSLRFWSRALSSLNNPVNPHSFFTHHLHVDHSHMRSFFKQRRRWNGIAGRKATASIFQRTKEDGREEWAQGKHYLHIEMGSKWDDSWGLK